MVFTSYKPRFTWGGYRGGYPRGLAWGLHGVNHGLPGGVSRWLSPGNLGIPGGAPTRGVRGHGANHVCVSHGSPGAYQGGSLTWCKPWLYKPWFTWCTLTRGVRGHGPWFTCGCIPGGVSGAAKLQVKNIGNVALETWPGRMFLEEDSNISFCAICGGFRGLMASNVN